MPEWAFGYIATIPCDELDGFIDGHKKDAQYETYLDANQTIKTFLEKADIILNSAPFKHELMSDMLHDVLSKAPNARNIHELMINAMDECLFDLREIKPQFLHVQYPPGQIIAQIKDPKNYSDVNVDQAIRGSNDTYPDIVKRAYLKWGNSIDMLYEAMKPAISTYPELASFHDNLGKLHWAINHFVDVLGSPGKLVRAKEDDDGTEALKKYELEDAIEEWGKWVQDLNNLTSKWPNSKFERLDDPQIRSIIKSLEDLARQHQTGGQQVLLQLQMELARLNRTRWWLS
jgi:hypothetical protein